MKVQKVLEDSANEEFCITKILHLPSIVALSQELGRRVPSGFEEFLDDSSGGSRSHCSTSVLLSHFKAQEESAAYDEDDENWNAGDDLEKLQLLTEDYTLLEDCQFLVQFRTNKRIYHGDKNSWSSSAGWYCTQWIAAPTIAKAWSMGYAWAKEMHKEDFKESNKG